LRDGSGENSKSSTAKRDPCRVSYRSSAHELRRSLNQLPPLGLRAPGLALVHRLGGRHLYRMPITMAPANVAKNAVAILSFMVASLNNGATRPPCTAFVPFCRLQRGASPVRSPALFAEFFPFVSPTLADADLGSTAVLRRSAIGCRVVKFAAGGGQHAVMQSSIHSKKTARFLTISYWQSR
jgi:hypothetical protein